MGLQTMIPTTRLSSTNIKNIFPLSLWIFLTRVINTYVKMKWKRNIQQKNTLLMFQKKKKITFYCLIPVRPCGTQKVDKGGEVNAMWKLEIKIWDLSHQQLTNSNRVYHRNCRDSVILNSFRFSSLRLTAIATAMCIRSHFEI